MREPGGYQGFGVDVVPYTPQDQYPRVGDGQIIHQEIFDKPLSGFGEVLRASEDVFGAPGRIGNPDRTNLKKVGELSDNKQFEIIATYAALYCRQDDDEPPPVGAPSASRCIDLYTWYTRQMLRIQNADKGGPFLSHRVAAGGGVWAGANENAGAFEKNIGSPDTKNVFVLLDPFTVPALKTFALQLAWAGALRAIGGALTFNPLDLFNANTTAEKVLAFGLIGYEVRDATNG